MWFLKKDENNPKFDNTIDSITTKSKTMGIVEVIRQQQIKALREEYTEKGKEEVVKNLLSANKFTVSEIANFAGVTEAFVRKIMKALK